MSKRTKPNGAPLVPGHLRRSNYLITINTNQVVDDNPDHEELIAHFMGLCKQLFSKNMFMQVVRTTP